MTDLTAPSDDHIEWYRRLLTEIPGDDGIDWAMVAADLLLAVDALRAAQSAALPVAADGEQEA